jgi:hypothetical protein
VGLKQLSRPTPRGRFQVRHECRDAVENALQSITLEFGGDVRIGYDIKQCFCLFLIEPFGILRRSGESQHLAVLGKKLPTFRDLFSARSRFDLGFDVITQPHQQESANGFGTTSAPVVSGSETQSGTLSPLPVIEIGGIKATVEFAGLVAPGEYQFNVVVPSSLSNADQPVTATYGGVSTQFGALITIHD